jgi:thiamine-phosphate pyrophosphorylase
MRGGAAPRLVAITDTTLLSGPELAARLERLAARATPGSVALLLRDHALSARARLQLGMALGDAARAHGQELWVADRLDLALLLGADGLHLGEASVTAGRARDWLREGTRVSRAWHHVALDAAPLNELEGVDALLVSPVLAARKGRPAVGLPQLGAWGEQLRARHQAYPLYALGGVTAENAAACLAAGATGVAAIGAALVEDPAPLLSALGSLR